MKKIAALLLLSAFCVCDLAYGGIAQADLSVTKTVNNATPNVGQQITFTITLQNNTVAGSATNVAVGDSLPPQLSFVSSTPSQGSYNDSTGVWAVGTVNNGTPATLLITATVISPNASTNTASISAADQPDPNVGNNSSNVTVTPQQADLAVSKATSSATPASGSNFTWTVTVSNTGPDTATNVVVNDLLPAGATFVSASPSAGTYNSGTGVWTIGTVTTSTPQTLAITATAAASPTSTLTNTASIGFADQFDPNNGNDSGSSTVTVSADLALTKIVSNPTPNVGDTITFTITLQYGGTGSTNGVQVTDQLPAGLAFVSATPSQGTYNNATGVWDLGSVSNGTQTLTIQAQVTSAGAKTNTAAITAAGASDPNAANNSASATVTPQQADLAVSKATSNATPASGSNFTWTVTASNNGPDNATNVVVNDLLPASVTFVSASPSAGTYNNITGVWSIGTVTPGAPQTLALTVTAGSPGTVTNTASITANQFDPNTANNSGSSTVTISGDLALIKTVNNATPNVGDVVTFTVTLQYNQVGSVTGVQVTDLLPAGLTFVSATPSAGTYASGTGIWSVGTVTSGTPQTLAIQATVASAGAKTNTATITAAGASDPNAANNTASATVTPPQADLAVSKATSNATPASGANFTWTVTVSNNGPNAATNVTVSDLVPAGVTFVSATPSQGTYASGTGVWTIGTLASAATATLALTVTAGPPATVTNTASVTHSDQFDSNAANNTASSAVTIQGFSSDLGLTVTASNTTPNVGSTVTLTVTLRNNGPNDTTGVTVTDLLPAGLTFISATPSQGSYDSATGVWTVGAVPNAATATLTIAASVTGPAPVTNTATITASAELDPNPANNTASVTITPVSLAIPVLSPLMLLLFAVTLMAFGALMLRS